MKSMKIGGKLKTTGNARKPVSGKPKFYEEPGLPGLEGMHEAVGSRKSGKAKIRGKGSGVSGRGGLGTC